MPKKTPKKMRIGISSCVLGEPVRFDGQHKKDASLIQLLGPHVEWVSICPEVEAGMTVPREPIHLEKVGKQTRLITVKSRKDVTKQLQNYSNKKVRSLKREKLSGFILKKGSPSCGLERVKCYEKNGYATRSSQGIFAAALTSAYPNLPVEEEGRLKDDGIRENFIERLFAYHRVNELFSKTWSVGKLVEFHSGHKLQLLAHSPEAYRSLGRLVAKAKKTPKEELKKKYSDAFMGALKKKATVGRNTNTLQHMAGYLKKQLDAKERKELADLIKDYRNGLIPLIVPVTLISHYVRKFEITYLMGQSYLEPNPRELMLRNHV